METNIREGINCQYCRSGTEIAEMRYGYVMQCTKCGAYVSLTSINTAKGCTANDELRKLRRATHPYLDKIIQMKVESGTKLIDAKKGLYDYIHKEMNFDFSFVSLAQLDEEETKKLQILLKKTIHNVEEKRRKRSKTIRNNA